jgi:DNA primase catalytic core
MLADGNRASVGDLMITRSNDRLLRVTATDWVKNGDRWTVLAIQDGGDLEVQHLRNRRTVRLPSTYVRTSAELGYATTVHAAQGVSVDTMHGLATGEESRQQLYTMLTRGKIANHLYLQVVGNGDPHTVIRPETVRPATPTDLLEQILARDGAVQSATTLQRDQDDPAARLGDAVRRYIDALHVAAENLAGAQAMAALDHAADQIVPGLSEEPAWPSLRGHLLLFAACGTDPVAQLRAVADGRELDSAQDRAAVLDWRLDDSQHSNGEPRPLPWLPAIPQQLRDDPTWGRYLSARAATIVELAGHVRTGAGAGPRPDWADHSGTRPPAGVVRDVEVWRAAVQVPAEDPRPTGPIQLHKAARIWQRRLDQAVVGDHPAWREWGWLIEKIGPGLRRDPFGPVLADRLAAISRTGLDARQLLQSAATTKPLSDDHAAAALWWRISRHLTPAMSAQLCQNQIPATWWAPRLSQLIGVDRAWAVQSSPWWSALVSAVDQGLQRGWRLEHLIRSDSKQPHAAADECQAMVMGISMALDPAPDDERYGPQPALAPQDPWQPTTDETAKFPELDEELTVGASDDAAAPGGGLEAGWVEPDLAVAAMVRDVAGPPEQTDADINRMFTRAAAWQECPVSRERMVEVNQLSLDYFRRHFPSSWGQQYLRDRFGQDLTNDSRFQPGQAPAGWTGLVDDLRRHRVTDQEIKVTGVAVVTSTGRLIDRFRDRVVFPIIHNGEVLGFIGRRHPNLTDDRRAPKYLNTADTPLFHKGAQLFGALERPSADGAIPVIVEGPMDAVAVTIASDGRHIAVATLGTSLTDEQAAQLTAICPHPVVATDADIAGQIAAERDFWLLTPYRLDPLYLRLPEGSDPADLLCRAGPAALTEALDGAQPLAQRLLDERLTNLPPTQALLEAVRVVAARPSRHWHPDSSEISSRLGVPTAQVRQHLLTLVREWNTDPRKAAQQPLQAVNEVKTRISGTGQSPPAPWSAALRRDSHPTKTSDTKRVLPSSRTRSPGTPGR